MKNNLLFGKVVLVTGCGSRDEGARIQQDS